jgi:uncharacterized protein involved in exopolysaccharide biosynthesis
MEHSQQTSAAGEEYRLLGMVAVLLRRWRVVAGVTLGVILLAGVAVLVLPRSYTVSTILVPSPHNSAGPPPQLLAAATLVSGGSLGALPGLGGGKASNEHLVQSILKSKSLQDSVASRVAAARGGDKEMVRQFRKLIRNNVDIRSDRNTRAITISVRSDDPELAADLAAEFPRVINDIVTRVANEAAVQQQATLGQQILVAREHVVESEEALLSFQRRSGATDVDEQAKRTVEAAAALQSAIIEQELRVAQLRRTVTGDHPELRNATAQLSDMRGQLRGITTGSTRSDVLLSATEFPELKVGLTRRLRDFMKDEQVYTSLTMALAQTQIDLKDYAAVVSVLDAPTVPEEPSGSRLLILLAGTVFGLVAGVSAAFGREYVERAQKEPESSQLFVEWEQVKTDLGRFGIRRKNGRDVMASSLKE